MKSEKVHERALPLVKKTASTEVNQVAGSSEAATDPIVG
jgi:hypothetical protein